MVGVTQGIFFVLYGGGAVLAVDSMRLDTVGPCCGQCLAGRKGFRRRDDRIPDNMSE